MSRCLLFLLVAGALSAGSLPLSAQGADSAARRAAECPSCAEWNRPHAPFRIHGTTWYVGTRGLSAILITSPDGHVLIDGGLPESAPLIMANIRALGFRVEDVRLVLNSHAHYDHAGGIGPIQRVAGAEVAAHPWSAAVMRRGTSLPEDPQFEVALPYPAVERVREIADGDTVRAGDIALTAHFTGGHTPGGTTWSWWSCEDGICFSLVYADSQTPISADGFLYTRSTRYPSALADFERGLAAIERLRCDVLLTPHPGASRMLERAQARAAGNPAAFLDRDACRAYAAAARENLARRVARERGGR